MNLWKLFPYITLCLTFVMLLMTYSVNGLEQANNNINLPYTGPLGSCSYNGYSNDVQSTTINSDDWKNACMLTSVSRLNAYWHNVSSETVLDKLKELLKDKKYKNTGWRTDGITDIPKFYDAKSDAINSILNRTVGENLINNEQFNWNSTGNCPAGVSPMKGKKPCPRKGNHFILTMLQPSGSIHTIECTATSDFNCVDGTGSMDCTDDSRQPGSAKLKLKLDSTGKLSGTVSPLNGGASFDLPGGFTAIRVIN